MSPGNFTPALNLAGVAVIYAGDQYVTINFSSSLPNNTQFILSPHGGPMPAGGYAVCNWGPNNSYVDICPYKRCGRQHQSACWRQHCHNLAGHPCLTTPSVSNGRQPGCPDGLSNVMELAFRRQQAAVSWRR